MPDPAATVHNLRKARRHCVAELNESLCLDAGVEIHTGDKKFVNAVQAATAKRPLLVQWIGLVLIDQKVMAVCRRNGQMSAQLVGPVIGVGMTPRGQLVVHTNNRLYYGAAVEPVNLSNYTHVEE